MKTLATVADMRDWREAAPGSVGLVPTMGFLHEGHLSLVRRSKRENDATVVSIFVNPTQFGPGEDFERYPRDEARDLELLTAAGVDAVFIPTVDEMYPPDFDEWVEVHGPVAQRLEGEHRPSHFRGVTTIVARLFRIIEPTRAYFGQKDAQQLRVIRRMTADLALPVEVVGLPIIREPDGLAMSSRN
ncbi:MAG: pantoate--beta-alanine ligase, partial [Chloroflexota bacterium]